MPTLYRVPVLGGNSTKVLDRVFGAIGFSPDGANFAFVRDTQDGTSLMVAQTDGGTEPRTISSVKQPSFFSRSGPAWSPDGKRIACGFLDAADGGSSSVAEIPVSGGEPHPIGTQKWGDVGRLIWLADGTALIMTARPESASVGTQIWLVPYDGGNARRITNDLNAYGDVSLGLTADLSTIATIQIITSSTISITAPNEPETQAQEIVKTNPPDFLSWTPDGRVVYAMRTGENWDIWIANADGSGSKQLTADAFIDRLPSVCGDGRYVVFQSNRSRSRNIWRMNLDGTNLKQLTFGNDVDAYPVCSPDGNSVVFMSTRSRIWTVSRVGIDGGTPVQVAKRSCELASISPDGKLIACVYPDESSNQPKVALIPFEGGEPVKTIELPHTASPIALAWLPDGKSIAYLDNASGILNIWSTPLDGGPPKQLTKFKSEFMNSFAISREGKIAAYRFIASRDIVLIKDFR